MVLLQRPAQVTQASAHSFQTLGETSPHFIHFYPIKNYSSQPRSLLFWEMRTERKLCSLARPKSLTEWGRVEMDKNFPQLEFQRPRGVTEKEKTSLRQREGGRGRRKKPRTHAICSKGSKGTSPGLMSPALCRHSQAQAEQRGASPCVGGGVDQQSRVSTGRGPGDVALWGFSFLLCTMGTITEPTAWSYCDDYIINYKLDLLHVSDVLLSIWYIK